jgi:hypothetical protein
VRRGHQTEDGCVNEDVRDTMADHLRSFVATEENTSVTGVSFLLTLSNFDPTSQFVVCLFCFSVLPVLVLYNPGHYTSEFILTLV